MLSQLEFTLETKPEDILTTTQVAKILGAAVVTIHLWIKSGEFPNAWQLRPRKNSKWRIPRSDVDAFIERRRQERGFIYLPPQVPTAQSNAELN